MMMDERNRIWILLSKRISGGITADEKIELEGLLLHDPEAWYTLEVLDAIKETEEVPEELVIEIQSLLQGRDHLTVSDAAVGVPPPVYRKKRWLANMVAAVAALLVIAGASLYFFSDETPQESTASMQEIISSKGSQLSHTMPDGTKIKMNAGSKITYAKNYATTTTREIFLAGEAYFEVVYNQHRPFIVHTPDFTIRNLGTSFNVKAYPDDVVVEAALIEGSIEVTLKADAEKKIVMKPNEKIIFYRKEGTTVDKDLAMLASHEGVDDYELTSLTIDEHTDEVVETAWLNDKIIFKQEPFGILVKKIERRFNVEIVIENEDISNQKLTGVFENEDLEASLKVLQMIAPFSYTIRGNTVYISR